MDVLAEYRVVLNWLSSPVIRSPRPHSRTVLAICLSVWPGAGVSDVLCITGISKGYSNGLPIEGFELWRGESEMYAVGLDSSSTIRGADCVRRRRRAEGIR